MILYSWQWEGAEVGNFMKSGEDTESQGYSKILKNLRKLLCPRMAGLEMVRIFMEMM